MEPGGAAQLVFDSELGRKAQLGQASLPEVWAWIGDHLGLSPDELADFERDFWAGDQLDLDLCNDIRELRVGYRTGMLSNTWARDGRTMAENLGMADCFDVFVTSAEIGIMKPDPRIYSITLERLSLSACEAIFVDDFIENVEAARRLGMQTIHFLDSAQLRRQLEVQLH